MLRASESGKVRSWRPFRVVVAAVAAAVVVVVVVGATNTRAHTRAHAHTHRLLRRGGLVLSGVPCKHIFDVVEVRACVMVKQRALQRAVPSKPQLEYPFNSTSFVPSCSLTNSTLA